MTSAEFMSVSAGVHPFLGFSDLYICLDMPGRGLISGECRQGTDHLKCSLCDTWDEKGCCHTQEPGCLAWRCFC